MMKSLVFHKTIRHHVLHIETDGCIVNVRPGLTDSRGRAVTSVEILADDYAGEHPWRIDGAKSKARNIRIIRAKGKE